MLSIQSFLSDKSLLFLFGFIVQYASHSLYAKMSKVPKAIGR